jgi:diketogulonate reductase-like aldo/keto reductase
MFLTATLAEDKTYDIVEAVEAVARELGSTPSRVALAWLLAKPGVSSPIIGARTLAQLDDNLQALEVKLSPAQLEKLDAVSKPKLNFPADFTQFVGSFAYGGTTIRGVEYPALPLAPRTDAERY